MPSVKPHGSGYRAQVYVKGARDSQTFSKRREAEAWAAVRDAELRAVGNGLANRFKTTHDAFKRYALEVSPSKDGERWEVVRLAKFARDFPAVPLDRLTDAHVIAWRDTRLSRVSGSSVQREMKLMSSVFEQARKEWKWLVVNPCKGVTKPSSPPHRKTVISGPQTRQMLRAMGYPARDLPRHATAHAFLLALLTGMRAGELAGLRWAYVRSSYVHLPKTKNGESRDVPLSRTAVKLLERMRGYRDDLVFGLAAASIDTQFRNARARAGLSGFTFHDSRHTAATRIGRARKLDVLELCKMFGWSDPKRAMIYFNPTPEQIAARL